MMQIASLFRRPLGLAALLLALCGFIGVAPAAMAAGATPSCSGGPSGSLSMPSVTVPSNTPVGTLLGNPVTITATFNCNGVPSVPAANGGTNAAGIQVFNLKASQLYPQQVPSPSNTNITVLTYATSVAGIGLQLTITPGMSGYDSTPGDQQANAYMVGNVPAPSGSLTVTYTAQLVVINNNGGQIGYGTIQGTTLLNYYWYVRGCQSLSGGCNGAQVSASLNSTLSLNGGAVVALPTCTIDAGSQNKAVTLPAITTTTMNGKGNTSGLTAFSIGLTCQSGANLSVTLTSSQSTSTAGVMNSTGSANGVGVRLLDQNQQPIQWNTATALGTVSSTTVSLPYYAQYYQTGNNVTIGKVSAQATITVAYQ
ncbi:fimbrial protein [Dyella telluris]|uniref:Fimbrial protein n=1 Tax=Dyella telluris TaxID=2763498 RepID=A0A7G8Q8E3_9GAMM|nr:fimbrial protein [Dyella telluris]QNK03051.1 fimbrial protein [Dyella telluris]